MKRSIEQIILAASNESGKNKEFTQKVMTEIRRSGKKNGLADAVRSNKTKRQSLFSRLRHLPTFAVVILAIVALMTISGTAYAIYTLWPKPEVHLESRETNKYGRTEVIASMQNCSDPSKQMKFEVKKSSTLKPEEVVKVIQAKCEIEAIQAWVGKKVDIHRFQPMPKDGDIQTDVMPLSVGSKVVSISDTEMSLTGDIYNTPKEPVTFSPETKFIDNGKEAKREDIKPGDTVMFVRRQTLKYHVGPMINDHATAETELLKNETLYVFKVNLPFDYYGPIKQNQLIEREPCQGNPKDTCFNGPRVVLYENFSVHPVYEGAGSEDGIMRTMQGVIKSYDGVKIVIESSSGRKFTLMLPNDIIATFNTQRSVHYNNVKVGVGDTLLLTYNDSKNHPLTTLGSNQIMDVSFVLDLITKSDPIKKY